MTMRDRILAVLDECSPHFTLLCIRQPRAEDLDGINDEDASNLEEWAHACRLTCIDVVDWALEPMPEWLAARLGPPKNKAASGG